MRTKDLIYAGAFGAMYIVLMLIIVMGSSALSPVLYFMAPLTVGLVCGTVYMLCVLKVHKFGAALIFGVFFTLIACTQSLYAVIFSMAAALTAELLLFVGKYQSRKMYLLSFVAFNLNMSTPTMMLLFDYNKFISLSEKYQGPAYAQTLAKLSFNGKIWFAIPGCAVVGGIGGALIAKNLVKKHFEKAGAV
ncbi:MAG: MptD family putative ECF transporter S component [Treponema sp.]